MGENKAYDITVSSGGENISDMGGKIILHAPYELGEGESAWGLVVYYVDEAGVKHKCVTNYDSAKKRVNWETTHLSVYMIDHVTYTSGYYPVVGGTSTTTKPVVSADTFDAGIGMYVAMSVMAAAGSAIVIGKKKEF